MPQAGIAPIKRPLAVAGLHPPILEVPPVKRMVHKIFDPPKLINCFEVSDLFSLYFGRTFAK